MFATHITDKETISFILKDFLPINKTKLKTKKGAQDIIECLGSNPSSASY